MSKLNFLYIQVRSVKPCERRGGHRVRFFGWCNPPPSKRVCEFTEPECMEWSTEVEYWRGAQECSRIFFPRNAYSVLHLGCPSEIEEIGCCVLSGWSDTE